MITKEMIEGLEAMYDWHSEFGFTPLIELKGKCIDDARKVVVAIIKALQDYDDLRASSLSL